MIKNTKFSNEPTLLLFRDNVQNKRSYLHRGQHDDSICSELFRITRRFGSGQSVVLHVVPLQPVELVDVQVCTERDLLDGSDLESRKQFVQLDANVLRQVGVLVCIKLAKNNIYFQIFRF